MIVKLDLRPLQALIHEADMHTAEATQDVAQELAKDLKERLPVRTGNLRNSISVKTGFSQGHAYTVVGADTEIVNRVGGQIVSPYQYLGVVDEIHGFMMRTLIDEGYMEKLTNAARSRIMECLRRSN